MINFSKTIFGILSTIWLTTGCSVLQKFTPDDRAKSVDFVDMYTNSLADKYKKDAANSSTTGLGAMLTTYDALPLKGSIRVAAETERNMAVRKQLETSLQNIAVDIRNTRERLSELGRKRLSIDSAGKKIDRKKASLTRQYKGDQLAQETENLEGQSDELALAITIIDNDIALQRDEMARLTEQQTKLTSDRSNILITDPVEESRRKMRDEIVKDYIVVADINYTKFKNDLLSGRAQTDTIADISELLLSTATTLTGGLTSKTNLGAASTLLKGSRSTVDKNFFAQQTMRAIVNIMEDGRAKDKLAIFAGLKKPTYDFPLSQAISEVQRYENRANLFSAILEIANQTGVSANKSAEQLLGEATAKLGKLSAGNE